jgi:hypothetical protein
MSDETRDKPKLTVLTTCSRAESLTLLAPGVAAGQDWFDLEWRVLFDGAKVSPQRRLEMELQISSIASGLPMHWGLIEAGHFQWQRGPNRFLAEVMDGWMWFLDDDNLVHPSFFAGLRELLAQQPEKRAWVFSQALLGPPPNVRVANPGAVRECHIDLAQYCIERGLIGEMKFPLRYSGDGAFVEAIYQRTPEAFGFSEQVLCYWNALGHSEFRGAEVD